MNRDHEHHHAAENGKGWWKSPGGITALFFLAGVGFFLFMEHRAHIVPFLPYLIILACPLMHMFHHGGHGDHNKKKGE